MHSRIYNEADVRITLRPQGPLLIKAGEGGADPTRPDMSFVRTAAGEVYLPGSSIKGVLRAHCERLARTARADLACDPLNDRASCGKRLEKDGNAKAPGHAYLHSCFVCRIFGNTGLASRFRVADARAVSPPVVEERNGVAIDRVFGSVAHGPFNYETVTDGEFATSLTVRNFTLAQLGLIALALRDLQAGRIRFGFGKSRGLGLLSARVDAFTLRYPTSEPEDGGLLAPGGERLEGGRLYGLAALADEEARRHCGLDGPDAAPMPAGFRYDGDDWIGAQVEAPAGEEGADWQPIGRMCAGMWKLEACGGRGA